MTNVLCVLCLGYPYAGWFTFVPGLQAGEAGGEDALLVSHLLRGRATKSLGTFPPLRPPTCRSPARSPLPSTPEECSARQCSWEQSGPACPLVCRWDAYRAKKQQGALLHGLRNMLHPPKKGSWGHFCPTTSPFIWQSLVRSLPHTSESSYDQRGTISGAWDNVGGSYRGSKIVKTLWIAFIENIKRKKNA